MHTQIPPTWLLHICEAELNKLTDKHHQADYPMHVCLLNKQTNNNDLCPQLQVRSNQTSSCMYPIPICNTHPLLSASSCSFKLSLIRLHQLGSKPSRRHSTTELEVSPLPLPTLRQAGGELPRQESESQPDRSLAQYGNKKHFTLREIKLEQRGLDQFFPQHRGTERGWKPLSARACPSKFLWSLRFSGLPFEGKAGRWLGLECPRGGIFKRPLPWPNLAAGG